MPDQTKGSGFENEEPLAELPGRTKIFAIAINKYIHTEVWPELKYPVGDCERLLKVLIENYGVDREEDLVVNPIFDDKAIRKDIINELVKLIGQPGGKGPIGPNDNLVLIFSGHGYFDNILGNFYWVFSEAKTPNPGEDDYTMLDVDKLIRILNKIPSKHILVIIDSCYSASFVQRPIEIPGELADKFKKYSTESPSRYVLTAGRDEKVPDKSFFADKLIEILEGNPKDELRITKIYTDLEEAAEEAGFPVPFCFNLVKTDAQGGKFVFRRSSEIQIPEKVGKGFDIDLLNKGSEEYLRKLKKGRFANLRIENILLPKTNLPELHQPTISFQEGISPLSHAINTIRSLPNNNAVILGDGGMGKTVSLIQLWENQLKEKEEPTPIFISLNEYNDVQDVQGKKNFLKQYIAKNYLHYPEDLKSISAVSHLLKKEIDPKKSTVSLLLDGFNEITVDKEGLLTELNELSQLPNVQVVTTSRFVEIQDFNWAREASKLELQPLPEESVRIYLGQAEIQFPEDEHLRKLISNPMMLTIYAGTNSLSNQFMDDNRFLFFPVYTEAELLWNFYEAQLANLISSNSTELEKVDISREVFLIRYLVPYLGWRMENEGRFFVTDRIAFDLDFNFPKIASEGLAYFEPLIESEFLKGIEDKEKLGFFYNSGEKDEWNTETEKAILVNRVRLALTEQLHLMVKEGEDFRFLHQNFRDFFAACHLRNCILFSIAKGNPPPEWKERILPSYLRKMIGELEGEYLFNPYDLLDGGPLPERIKNNLIGRLLDNCRDKKMEGDFTVWNLVTVLHETRCNLAGADLGRLDLGNIVLNNIQFSVSKNISFLPARMEGATLNGRQFMFEGHTSSINSVIYSPRGKEILSASNDHTIKEWSVNTGECLKTLIGHTSSVNSAVYSPNGKKILTASTDKSIKEWSAQTGKCLKTIIGHHSHVYSAIYSPDGLKILSASEDKTIKEWSAHTWKCIKTFKGHISCVYSAVYSPDKKKILSASRDHTIKEWSVNTGKCQQTMTGHNDAVNSAIYSPSGKKILSASRDKTIKEWSAKTGECLKTLNGHYDAVNSAVYSPDGKKILSTSKDKTFKEWEIDSKICLKTIGHHNIFNRAIYSYNYEKILSADQKGTIKEWSTENNECLKTIFGYNINISSANYSPNCKKIINNSGDHSIKEWSIQSGKCLKTFKGHADTVHFAIYSLDGKKILSSSSDKTIKEWSVKTGECLKTFSGHNAGVLMATYSPSGEIILSTSNDKTIKLWSLNSGNCIKSFDGLPKFIKAATFSPDGKKILLISSSKTVIELSEENGECIKTYPGHVVEVSSAVYSTDGKKILTSAADHYIKEWSTDTGECLNTIVWSHDGFSSANYSPDCKKIVSISLDKLIKEWSIDTGKCLKTFSGQTESINSALYSIDGHKILSASSKFIREWKVETGELLYEYVNEIGLLVHGLDFRHLDSKSKITKEEKTKLRQFGAIFDDEDERIWKEALEDAYGGEDC